MKPTVDYTLYLCTDRALMTASTLEDCVEQALVGGCTVVQLREKDVSALEFYNLAVRIKRITSRFHVPLIINDRVDVALAADADGVHVGQSDLPANIVRKILGPDKLLGVSVQTTQEALRAAQDGADYLGVGAMFATATKTDAKLVSMEELKHIRAAVALPIVVIGGINQQTAPRFLGTGINGLAVVSAVVAQKDIAAAARSLKSIFSA